MLNVDGKIAVLMLSRDPQADKDGEVWVTPMVPLPLVLVNVLDAKFPPMPLPETVRKSYSDAREVLVHPKTMAIKTVSNTFFEFFITRTFLFYRIADQRSGSLRVPTPNQFPCL